MRNQNPGCDWIKVSFRVFGATLNPEEVTAATGIAPDFHAKVGEQPRNRAGEIYRESLPPARKGHWHLQSKAAAASTKLDDHVEEILQRLEGHQDYFADLAKTHHIDLFIGWSGGLRGEVRPRLSQSLMDSIASFGAIVDFDIYDRND